MNNQIPLGWNETSINELLKESSLYSDGDWVESKDQDEEGANRLIQLADIGEGGFQNKSNKFMNDEQFRKLRCTELKEGDILIARMPEPLGRACFFPKISQRCATVVDVAILRNPKADAYWLMSMINSSKFRRMIENHSTGTTRTRITRGFLADLRFLAPSIAIQQKIAAILKVLDQAIEQTEALIHKYQQIKAGLMHDLFTRGLTADGKLRPPRGQALELYQETPLGWIPKEWILTTCSKICEKIIDCKNRTPPITPDGFPVIRTPNVRKGEFVDKELVFTDYHSYSVWTARGKPTVGDVVITREAPVGEVCMIPDRHPNACLGQRMMLYRPNVEVIDPKFFLYVLQSQAIQNRLDLISGGSTVGHVRVGDIRDLWIFYPKDQEEQIKIGTMLSAITKKIELERAKVKKLNQQKSGLMHDLLTGKVLVTIDQAETAHV